MVERRRLSPVVGEDTTDRGDVPDLEVTRVDRWLWAVRLYHTRSLATDACRGGHVRINGTSAKPASNVRVGDRVEVRQGERRRIVEVVRVIDRRVGAPISASCLVDHSPARPPAELAAPALVRDASTGRPTKKDRRRIDQLRRR